MKKKHYVLTGDKSKMFLVANDFQREIKKATIIKDMFGLPVAIDFGYLGYIESIKIVFKAGQILSRFSTIDTDRDFKIMVENQ